MSDNDSGKVMLMGMYAFEASFINLDSGLNIAKKALALAKKQNFKRGTAFCYNAMGTIYNDKADYKMAVECYTEALKILETTQDDAIHTSILGNAAVTYGLLKDFPNARKAMFECLHIFQSIGANGNFFGTYLTLGNLYQDHKMVDSALYYYDLAIHSKHPAEKVYDIVLHGSMGACYQAKKQYTLSEQEFKLAINEAKEIRSDYYYFIYGESLGELYVETGRYKEAESLILNGLKYYNSSALTRDMINAYFALYKLHSKQKNYKTALEYHEKYWALNDSINNAETNKIARELEKKYEDQKKIAQIEKLNSENIAGEAENERKGQLLVFAIIGCVLVLIALGFAVYAFINKRKANIELQVLHNAVNEQKNELLEKNKSITDSIHYAQRIQKALLSSRSYIKEHANDFFIIHKPKDIVSGDFYWAQRSGDDLFFMLSDCTGHGVPGAFMSLLGISYLNELVVGQKNKDTDKILNGLRANIIQALTDNTYEMKDGMDGVLCRFNFKKLSLQYSAANNSIVIIRDNNIIELSGDKMPVGRSPRDSENFVAHDFELKKNDMIYLFTDGFPDQFGGPKGKKLKERSLKEMLLKWHELSLEEQEISLNAYFSDWKKDLEQVDDVTLVGFKI
jgi:serine phosphatase RsbU (regulator of sigma subunit)